MNALSPILTEMLPDRTAPTQEDDPLLTKSARLGWIAILMFFGLFLGFAMFARLDAAAYADGTVKVVGDRQAVQHRDGGTIAALRVREGQSVKAGQVLIELAGGDVAANERSLTAQVIDLLAERALLQAQRSGAASIMVPPEFAALPAEDQPAAEAALALARTQLAGRRTALASQRRVLDQQAAQLGEQIGGLSRQMQANRRQDQSYSDQLEGIRDLAAKGYASANRVRELERARAGLDGQFADMDSNQAAARQHIGELRMRALGLDADDQRQASDDLRRVEDQLGEVYPRWREARRQRDALQIRAPATGQVVGLAVFTVGGVITPGQKLMEIVPSAAPLVIEAKVNPNDADDLSVGQQAEIRVPALHDRNLPVLNGTISRLSADAFTDERTGARFYTAEVTVAAADLARIRAIEGNRGVRPGMAINVLIPLRKRTMLDYLLEPLDQALWRSGREH